MPGKVTFKDVVEFKRSIAARDRRFAKAFTRHLLRFAVSRQLVPADAVTVDRILDATEKDRFRLQTLVREVVLSDTFRRTDE